MKKNHVFITKAKQIIEYYFHFSINCEKVTKYTKQSLSGLYNLWNGLCGSKDKYIS